MNKYLDIINHFGVKNQCKKLNEECYELIEAIKENDNEHITEEMADVIVLLTQFIAHFDIKKDKLDKMVYYKISRTEERIKSNYYETYK